MNATEIRNSALAKAESIIKDSETKAAIVEGLPLAPRFVHVYTLYKRVASVSYDAENKAAAFNIASLFTALPAYVTRMNGVSVRCYDDEKADTTEEVLYWVRIAQSGASLNFFAASGVGVIQVEIRLPVSEFGYYYKDKPNERTNYTMEFAAHNKTNTMFRAATYARAYPTGPQSGREYLHVMYDVHELENLFNA
ncbi:MAG TPA: hypothetical protein VFM46_01505 [Pseudomonadales bacterium]|nr:hypothetical protein [Pseudomonadales bacterium]